MPPPTYFPLRWESTGDQWWYASPIDYAAANGHYDLVRELLRIDNNHLFKLTSLRRIRRLETVWDDEELFDDVSKCRSRVARKLFLECEAKKGKNSLFQAGYGGWLIYTAASAGDFVFVQELLGKDPLLVFGEGEYGVTDILYAAARSKNSKVFRLLYDFAVSPRFLTSKGGEVEQNIGEIPSAFKWEMMNRAVHAAARGGNLEILKELLRDCSDVFVYRDVQGSTILHTASGRGQVEVVKDLVASYDTITSTDNQGNTALHVAAYRGHLAVVEFLILSSSSSTSLTNNYGDTFLHVAVAGFRTPGFRRMDRQIELMKRLVCGKIVNLQDIINVRNKGGRTALHVAVTENVQSNLVELLMTVPSIHLNIRDADGMTPLDLLKQRPRSASSEFLIKQLISAGGISNCQDYRTRSALASHLKMQGIGRSPGTSFRISDAEIYLYMDIENENASEASCDPEISVCSSELSQYGSGNLLQIKKLGSVSYAARRLKNLLQWSRGKERKAANEHLKDDDEYSLNSVNMNGNLLEDSPIPLRQRYSKTISFLPNNKRTLSLRNTLLPSPSTKRKFAAGLMHGVIQAMPHLTISSPLSGSSVSSASSMHKQKGNCVEIEEPSCSNHTFNGEKQQMIKQQTSLNKKLMNQYLCFGAQGLTVEDSIRRTRPSQSCNHVGSLVA